MAVLGIASLATAEAGSDPREVAQRRLPAPPAFSVVGAFAKASSGLWLLFKLSV
jgi:hypothetical protein